MDEFLVSLNLFKVSSIPSKFTLDSFHAEACKTETTLERKLATVFGIILRVSFRDYNFLSRLNFLAKKLLDVLPKYSIISINSLLLKIVKIKIRKSYTEILSTYRLVMDDKTEESKMQQVYCQVKGNKQFLYLRNSKKFDTSWTYTTFPELLKINPENLR